MTEGAPPTDAMLALAIVESVDEPIFAIDLDGAILTWNRCAERVYGYSTSQAVGQPISTLLAPDQREDIPSWLAAVRRGESTKNDTVCLRENGVAVDVALALSPLRDGSGALVGAGVVARDITEQQWMAQTLTATLQSLEAALADARESESLCRRFLANAAHQLRSPIAGIQATAESLLYGSTAEQRDRLLANVVRDTSRAGRLMAGLLKMARLDQGETLTPMACDLVALCQDEADRARALCSGLDVTVEVTQVHQPRPLLDANVVREILANLFDNARRHAKSRIEVVVRVGPDTAEIRVSDDGPGIPDAMVQPAFERFVSLDGRGGSGLGLPIARGMARAHGGDLTYEDRSFILRLPADAERPDCGGASRPGPPPVQWGALSAEPMRTPQ